MRLGPLGGGIATRYDVPSWIKPIAECFFEAGYELSLVGGYARNAVMGLPYSDIDACSAALPEKAAELAGRAGASAHMREGGLGTVDISTPFGAMEYTPFRTESYPKGGAHRPERIAFTGYMLLDAKRRDFTVNALYLNARTGELTDPFCALGDIEKKLLRPCDLPERTIADDGLRILRMARFSAELGFTPDEALFSAAKDNAANVKDISGQRIGLEMEKMMLADIKYPGLKQAGAHCRALRMLDETGALAHVFPELMEGKGVQQKAQYHAYDVFEHLMHSFLVSPPDMELRLSALLHDVAKPRRAAALGGKMTGHDIESAKMAGPMLLRLGFSKEITDNVCLLIARHMFDLTGAAKESTCRVRFAGWGFAFVEKLIELRRADVIGSGRTDACPTADKWSAILKSMREEGAIDDMRMLAISGEDIMRAAKLPPGKKVGRIKEILFRMAAVNPRINTRERLIAEAARISANIGG